MIRTIFQLLRVKHWVKNVLICIPLLFSLNISPGHIPTLLVGFVLFSIASSIVYIINDINDKDDDRKHPTKRHRPIASGRVATRTAWLSVAVLISVAIGLVTLYPSLNSTSGSIVAFYVIINVLYSLRLKHIPIVDIFILATGFVLRVIFGAVIFNIPLSDWLLLTVLCGSLYMGIGKRRNELSMSKSTRKVNKLYSFNFLNNSLYAFSALTICFYSLWSINDTSHIPHAIYTAPLVTLILMSYNLKLDSKSCDGDPVNVLLGDKTMIVLTISYVLLLVALIATRGVVS